MKMHAALGASSLARGGQAVPYVGSEGTGFSLAVAWGGSP